MSVRTTLAAALTLMAISAIPASARADEWVASGSPHPSSYEPDVDAIGSMRAGLGYSRLMHSRILSLSFEDQFRIHRYTDALGLTVVFGMDVQDPLDTPHRERGFMAVTLGPGLLLHPEGGPGFTFATTMSPLLQSRDDSTHLGGFGIGFRAEAYPFYQTLLEAVKCERGTFSTYVLSGLHGWGQVRQDWLGSSGQSWAVGFGFDLARNALLPIIGATFDAACTNPPTRY